MIERTQIESAFDVVVVGSGAAGCAAASAAAIAGRRVLLLSKDPFAASDTKIAEGIVTVLGSAEQADTFDVLSLNMRVQGDDLADSQLTEAFARDSESAYRWLIEHGLLSGLNEDNSLQVLPVPLGGHDRRRSVEHENGALDYAHALWNAVHRHSDITVMEDAWALDILKAEEPNRVVGLMVYHAARGEFHCISCQSLVLACGGASSLYYPCTDTMRGNTGDGYAMALRAGLALVDMEQVQFLPFGIAAPRAYEGILAGEPVSCGPLGVLRDNSGKIILSELMVRTRAECAAAIAIAVATGRGTDNGGCWLDLTQNVEGNAGAMFLQIMRDKMGATLANIKKAMGQKAARFEEFWEVRPTAHYFMGGVEADRDGATSLPGLFVAGQVLGGLHGSNRLGSTSLAEGTIFGLRAGRAAVQFAECYSREPLAARAHFVSLLEQIDSVTNGCSTESVYAIQRLLQTSAFEGVGPARSAQQLTEFERTLDDLSERIYHADIAGPKVWNQRLIDYFDTRNMIASARAILASAKARTNSLGAHVRIDGHKQGISNNESARVEYKHGETVVSSVQRLPSPRIKRWLFKLAELGRLLRLKVVRNLPSRARDRVLMKIYRTIL